MDNPLVKTIHKVRVAGKYIEFWFKEDLVRDKEIVNEQDKFFYEESFNACHKLYDFIEILEIEGIYNNVLNNGMKGLKTRWEYSEHKTYLKFVDFANETRIVLIEKYK